MGQRDEQEEERVYWKLYGKHGKPYTVRAIQPKPNGMVKSGLREDVADTCVSGKRGKIQASDIGTGKGMKSERRGIPTFIGKYEELVRAQREEIFGGVKDWRIFEHERVGKAAPSGTKVALDALARIRNIA